MHLFGQKFFFDPPLPSGEKIWYQKRWGGGTKWSECTIYIPGLFLNILIGLPLSQRVYITVYWHSKFKPNFPLMAPFLPNAPPPFSLLLNGDLYSEKYTYTYSVSLSPFLSSSLSLSKSCMKRLINEWFHHFCFRFGKVVNIEVKHKRDIGRH